MRTMRVIVEIEYDETETDENQVIEFIGASIDVMQRASTYSGIFNHTVRREQSCWQYGV